MERALDLTGMEYGGINPIGLPEAWPILIDPRVVETDVVLSGTEYASPSFYFRDTYSLNCPMRRSSMGSVCQVPSNRQSLQQGWIVTVFVA